MTKREEINAKIAELERVIYASNEEITSLKGQLHDLPAGVLDQDLVAEGRAETERKNRILRERGYLPAE